MILLYVGVIILYSSVRLCCAFVPPLPASTPGVFDHMVVNETLDSTYHQLRDIILKVHRHMTVT